MCACEEGLILCSGIMDLWLGLIRIHRYDVDKSGFIDLMELKLMMEKLGEPQTHLGLKGMIREVDEDNDGQISFREVGSIL